MLRVDLHVHSNYSDGTLSPKELVHYAMEKGLAAFALTDHDTVAGLDEAISYAKKLRLNRPFSRGSKSKGENGTLKNTDAPTDAAPPQPPLIPEVIPGIEFSTEYQGRDVHIVGLYIDYHHPSFEGQLREFVDSRTTRNLKMCGLLREAGIDITYEALLAEFPGAVITRAHYAKYLLCHGYIQSMQEAFERYVGDRCPCYVPREKVTPAQAVKLISEAGGISVFAHPILCRISDERLDTLTAELKAAGLMGIEAIYSTYKPHEERQIRALARKYNLLISGGSDFHGGNKPGLDLGTGYGNLFVPMDLLDKIKKSASHSCEICFANS